MTTATKTRMLRAALAYAEMGWYVVPLYEPLFNEVGECIGCTCEAWKRKKYDADYVCATPGKHPCITDWENEATTDPAKIEGWYRRWPNANIGIAAGRSGLVCVDSDSYKEGGGELSFADKDTVTNLTGGGGEHLIYLHPADGPRISNADSTLPEWVNIRAHGGQFVAPPSRHQSSRRYEWESGYGPHERDPAPLPAALRKILQTEKPKAAPPIDDVITKGKRHTSLVSLAGTMRRRGMGREAIEAALLATNEAQCDPPKPEQEVKDIAEWAAKLEPEAAVFSANGNGTGADTAGAATVLNYRAEDGGMLDAWVDEDGANWIYAAGNEQWYRWSVSHWRPDKGYALKADIQRKLDIFNQEARELRKAAGDSDRRKMLTAYVKATKRTKARINSIEGLARNERWVDGDTLDSAALLNLKDCTLDLETFQRRPHDRADLLTYCLPYAYDPAEDAPAWRYLMGCLKPEIADFLQEFAGYVLTPDTKYELSLWFYGPPGGGKSTTIHGFQTMLGPKAGLLGLADIERNRFALANIPGKTLVVSTEQPGNYLASTHVLNAIISGEPVTVDRKFRDPVDVTPRCKILWAMNDFPRVSDANNGIFRRVKVINFPAVSEEQRRPELKEAISNEGAGILNWALEGLKRLQARGRFVIPKAVEDATADFIQQNDIVGNFVEECCLTGTDYKAQSSQLYRAYKAWALETGHKPQSMTSIAGEWKRLGFEKYASNGRVYWRGVGLLAPQDDEDDEND